VKVQIEKKGDGASVMRCVRPDGSVTYQKHQGRQGAFFPVHDLTHFAVESEVPRLAGFYSLIASGWNMEDTTGKGARGPIPDDAIAVEKIVGRLDLERAGVASFTADDLGLGEDELERVWRRIRELTSAWEELPPGGTLELTWIAPSSR
jgi:hypothetical protein